MGRELFGLFEFVILSAVATQWKVECPRCDEIGSVNTFPHPVSSLWRPAIHSTCLQGVVFASEGRMS